jgi:2-polyprenyl-3-methyl-5-hydroxy-6-metoxy-1,4-benzoquinol methylase
VTEVLDLGTTAFTGVFPASVEENVDDGRLCLVVCEDCGLAQLADSFPAEVLYGDNYGYRSGLNASMLQHLKRTAHRLERLAGLSAGDVVLDIGANDGSLLRSYETPGLVKVGIDPTIAKFIDFYAHDVDTTCVPDFFNAANFDSASEKRAKVVTSIAMFYDLEDPVAFARDIRHCLDTEGLWHFEQSYMPWMLRSGAYDTICHEHLEYYSLTTIKRILDDAGMRIVDVATNAVNGGSISVTAARDDSSWTTVSIIPDWLLEEERRNKVHEVATWGAFADTVRARQADLLELLTALRASGKKVMGLGASTKGNVLLQTTGITPELVSCIGDVNPYKFGRFMPGTGIPIVSEAEVLAMDPDYLLVLPWHFRETFMVTLESFLSRGGRLIFPLPDIEIVGY